ncbi:hypothetical protein [Microcoleus sp. D2_18a_D3]|uniref:hypothetical protein n=1 Tax=Microcoleus sp. D2_18a_D3 TaxID=3055330 RepID=UPI002FD63559
MVIAHRIQKPGFFLYLSFLSAKIVETGFLASKPAGWVRRVNHTNQEKSQISNLKSKIVLMPRAIANSFETLLKFERTLPFFNQSQPLDIPTLRTAIIKINTAAAGINTIIELCRAS